MKIPNSRHDAPFVTIFIAWCDFHTSVAIVILLACSKLKMKKNNLTSHILYHPQYNFKHAAMVSSGQTREQMHRRLKTVHSSLLQVTPSRRSVQYSIICEPQKKPTP
jgi:hypothetical protein